ncbi:MAG: hypothetical protein ABJB11_15855 [Ferruginibacter sp.]
MGRYLLIVLDWSEVWALLIPLVVLLLRRRQPVYIRPVIVYLWLALLINAVIDVVMAINIYVPGSALSNNPYYNVHSVLRFACFSYYFIKLPQPAFVKLKWFIVLFSVLFMFIDFLFFEDFFNYDHFSGTLLVTEAYLLLIYCLQYYLAVLRSDDDNLFKGPDFWIVTGLGIYVVVNFFVFLFYIPMLKVDISLATNIWNVHNIAFIIFCIFITKALYGTFRNKFTG